MRFDGRTAIVTGASRGLGRRIALDFAAAGANVVLTARDRDALSRVAAEAAQEGAKPIIVQADVTHAGECDRLVSEALEAFGRLDILVNNAGIAGPTKMVVDLEPSEWEEVLRTNLTAPYLCIRAAAKPMMRAKSGAIVNIGSAVGKRPLARRAPYAASKMGLIGLTRTLALELGPCGIRVNAINPGPIEGARMDSVIRTMAKAQNVPENQVREFFTDDSPLGVMMQETDISAMALYLASDLARHMTGQDINVTAGRMMY
ncbi:MAG TPA: SDR family NAD(P)-dependent oxidoreductase [Xanthobacteraceae bacterium]